MRNSADLDAIDRRILTELQRNALLSNAELAERVGSSAASCWRRVKAMEASGVLGPTVRLLNPDAVDLGVNVFCHVRMRSHSHEPIMLFEDFVRARPEVMECYSMSGEWDYLLRIVVTDVTGYQRFLMSVLLEHPSVGGASSHFALSQAKYTTRLPV